MILAQIFALSGTSAVAATLPTLISSWSLSPVQAGWLGGAYFLGYAAAVPFLVSLTDRFDARWVFASGCAIGVLANAGFATLANGLAPALALWALAGVSIAGVYMPGLRVVTERVDPRFRLRVVPYYTASFGVGISASFFMAGSLAQLWGWRSAFAFAALGSLLAAACLLIATARTSLNAERQRGSGMFDLQRVLKNRAVMRYVLAYGGHSWELFALRAWLVTFLLYAWNRTVGGNPGHALTNWSTAIALAGVPASILGAEWALRSKRRRLIASFSILSVAVALLTVWASTLSFALAALALVIYNIAILGDSGALTAGVLDAASVDAQGSTLAFYSLVGFAGGGLGPIAVGIALASAGGAAAVSGWTAAFIVMAGGSGLAAFTMLKGKR
jgi:predicted MFS family arabinose efflux permease